MFKIKIITKNFKKKIFFYLENNNENAENLLRIDCEIE